MNLKNASDKIAQEIITQGLRYSQWQTRHPEAYEDLQLYTVDISRAVENKLTEMLKELL